MRIRIPHTGRSWIGRGILAIRRRRGWTTCSPRPPSHSGADLVLRKGYVVYLPVYQEDLPAFQKDEPEDLVAERRRTLRGFVVGTFRADELFANTFGKTFHPAIDFEVYDGENAISSSLLYDKNGVRNAGEKGNAALFSEVRLIKAAGARPEGASGAFTSPRCQHSREGPGATSPPSCS